MTDSPKTEPKTKVLLEVAKLLATIAIRLISGRKQELIAIEHRRLH